MTKTRDWPVRAMYMLIAAALVISLIIVAAPTQKVAADPGLSEWDEVSTPTTGGWVLAPESVIIDYALASAGEVAYAVVEAWNEDGDTYDYRLLKSDDHAATWTDIRDALEAVIDIDDGDYIDELVQVATDWEDADFVAVALWWWDDSEGSYYLSVFLSADGGDTFEDGGEVEDGAYFDSPDDVADLAVSSEAAGKREIAIGGQDDSGDAALFRCTVAGDNPGVWEDTTLYDGWDKDGANSAAVVDFKFAPSWLTDYTVLVLTVPATGNNVHLQSGTWGTIEAWNDEAGFEKAVAIFSTDLTTPLPLATLGTLVAGINTPLDYSGQDAAMRYVWVNVNYVDAGDPDGPSVGKIFRVKNKSVIPVNQQIEGKPWLTNVSYLGYISEGKAIASLLGDGLCNDCEGVQVYRNDSIINMDICCLPWDEACKPPTGRLAMAVSYVSADKAYAVALQGTPLYEEGAWSVSFDDGDTWNQLSLVDTDIDFLSDVAVSPDCNKTMLVSVNRNSGCECDSVWLYADTLPEAPEYSGQWLRTWCGELEGVVPYGQHGMLRLAPEETTGDTVYLVDRGTSTIYWNELETLACWKKRSATSIVDNIVDLAVKDESTIYALDASGAVAMSDDHGASPSWEEAVDSEVTNGWTIAVLGDHILVGGQDGDVSYSDDGGETFAALEDTPTAGLVTVAVDSYFDANDTVYAAVFVDPTDGGVYRWVIDESEEWKDLRAEPSTFDLTGTGLTTDSHTVGFTGLVVDRPGNPFTSSDKGGVLYASYVAQVGGDIVTGVARSLERDIAVCATCIIWDFLHVGLTVDQEGFYMMPQALKICGCLTPDSNSKLFAIDGIYDGDGPGYDMFDGSDGTVWSFEDCYAKKAPEISSPADEVVIPADPCSCYSVPFTILWDTLCDACSYDIEFAMDEDFDMPVKVNGEDMPFHLEEQDVPAFSIMGGPDGGLSCETTYYVRVRAADAATGQIIHSWWSDPIAVKIAPSTAAGEIDLVSPEPGATGVAVEGVGFSWDLLAEADAFDWVIDDNSDLSSPVESKIGLPSTAYECTKTLSYDTTYYWMVTAYNEGAAISMSAVGTFRTMTKPIGPGETPPTPTPAWVWVIIAIGAVLVIVVIVLIFRTRRV